MFTITNSAAEKIKDLIIEQNDSDIKGLRVFVQGGGCSGFQYGFTFDNKINEDDFEIEASNIKVLIDSISSGYIQGAVLDYKEEPFSSQFVISNPNAKSTCGCGSSFNA
jgi:iron-sulfur cluster insertion protein